MTTIKLKNGSGAPTAGDLVQGEPALDLTNKRLYTEDSGGTVIEVGTNPGTDVTFADNRKAIFGAGSDLQIYHDGSTSVIKDAGTGELQLHAENNLRLQNLTGSTYALFSNGAAASLYYNGSAKLATTSTGIDVTGTAGADTLETSTASGGLINIVRDDPTIGTNNSLGAIYWNSTEDSGTTVNQGAAILALADQNHSTIASGSRLSLQTTAVSATTPTERLRISAGGDITFYDTDGTTASFVYDASAGLTINEAGADRDFRVESNTSTHMLFVDGGTNRVGINDSAPDKSLHVSNAGTAEIRVQNSTNNYALDLGMNDELGQVKASANIALLPGGAEKWLIDSSGNVTQTNTSGGSGSGPYYDLHRDSGSPAANDLGPIIRFRGDNSAGGVHTYANIYAQFTDVTDAGEDCTVHHQVSVAGTPRSVLSLKGNAEVSVNEESQNIDFRVESDSATHLLFADAGLNRVGIKNSSPDYVLEVGDPAGSEASIAISSGGTSDKKLVFKRSTSEDYVLVEDSSENLSLNGPSGLAKEFVINNTSVDLDFRVESNSNTQALLVDSGGDFVAMGNTIKNPASGFSDQHGVGIDVQNGSVQIASDAQPLEINRTTTGGATGGFINFRKEGAMAYDFSMDANGMVFNEAGGNRDLRVESDSETHMLFVDAGTNKVGVATSAPRTELDVDGDIALPSGMHISREGVVTTATSVTQRYVFTHNANNNWGSCVIDYAVTGTTATSSSQNYKRGLITFTKYSADATPMRNIVYTDIVAGSGITVTVSNTSTTQFTVDFSFSSGSSVNRHIGSTISITTAEIDLTAVTHSVF